MVAYYVKVLAAKGDALIRNFPTFLRQIGLISTARGGPIKETDDEDGFEDAQSLLARSLEDLVKLKDAIRRLHGCESEYAGREEVIITFQDERVWSGYVEGFNITGHPQATRCYAWSHLAGEEDGGEPFVVVLELPPVDSAETAVRAAIMAEIKSARDEMKKGRTS